MAPVESFNKWRYPAAALLLAVLTGAAYAPAWKAGFVWDDDKYVTGNPLITAPDGLERIWFSQDSPSQYFPLVYTSFRIEHALFGFEPLGYHLTNILLHALNALLLWRLLLRMGLPGAFAAAAVFALHPVQVESVAWITERKNVLMAAFYFMSLLAWMRFALPSSRAGRAWPLHALSLFLYLLALLSKSTACTLPAALVLILWWKRIPLNAGRWLRIAPYVLLGLAMGLLSIWWEEHHQGTRAAALGLSAADRVLIAGRALWFYAAKLVWPADLAFSYPRFEIDAADPLQYAWPLAFLALVIGLWRFRDRLGRGPLAAVLFFAATLSPMLGFFSLYTFHYSFTADHYQYVACAGLIALFTGGAAAAWRKLDSRKRALISMLGVLLLAGLSMLTWRQSAVYRDQETLWRDTLEKNPDSWMAHNNLGLVLEDQGDLDQAVAHYRRAIELKPGDIEPLGNLGNALARQGKYGEAIRCFERALEIDPDHYFTYMTYTDMGNAYAGQGRIDEALESYYKALRIQPDYSKAHYNLGKVLAGREEYDRAAYHYRRALQGEPDYFLAHWQLSETLVRLGDIAGAVEHLEAALDARPDFAEGRYRLGQLLVKRGALNQAAESFTEALRLDPALKEREVPSIADIRVHYNQGIGLAREGRFDEAAEAFGRALEIEPEFAPACKALGNALASLDRIGQAIEAFRRALEFLPEDANIHFKLALLLILQGEKEEAERCLRRTLELAPGHPGALERLERRK